MQKKLDCIAELQKLGFVSVVQGELDEKDKILLLHIINAKLKNQKIDKDKLLKAIKQAESVSNDDFETAFYDAYNTLGERKKQELGEGEKLGLSRSFESFQDVVSKRSKTFSLKKQEYDVICTWLTDEASFDAFCQNANVANKEVLKKGLENKFGIVEKEYYNMKIDGCNEAVDYLVWMGVRVGCFDESKSQEGINR